MTLAAGVNLLVPANNVRELFAVFNGSRSRS